MVGTNVGVKDGANSGRKFGAEVKISTGGNVGLTEVKLTALSLLVGLGEEDSVWVRVKDPAVAGMDVSTAARLGATVNVDSAGVISGGGDIMPLDQIKANPITPNPPRSPAAQTHLLKLPFCGCRDVMEGAATIFFSARGACFGTTFSVVARCGAWGLAGRRKASCLVARAALAFSRAVSSCW